MGLKDGYGPVPMRCPVREESQAPMGLNGYLL